MVVPESCSLCPRSCGVDRHNHDGFCGAGGTLKAARAALHFWEEPCISGTHGSGTVFFSGCTLRCCYCQNWNISAEGYGQEINTNQLCNLFLNLQEKGAHNINLVTPTQWLPWIVESIQLARSEGLNLPIVYNTGGYETEEIIHFLKSYVDIWLADIKYFSSELAKQYSAAPDYPSVNQTAIKAMITQTGHPVFNPDGILQKGVILRHLVLPGCAADSLKVLDYMASLPKGSFIPSFMSQYTPFYKATDMPPLNRRITTYEYQKIIDRAVELGLTNGYMQKKSSAREEYTPPFDLEGLPH